MFDNELYTGLLTLQAHALFNSVVEDAPASRRELSILIQTELVSDGFINITGLQRWLKLLALLEKSPDSKRFAVIRRIDASL